MSAGVLADALIVLHALFVLFVIAGGALVLWRPAVAIIHAPAAAWGAWVEFTGTICPLTPLENAWRRAAGGAGYEGGFIEHHIVPMLYPEALTPRMQFAFGVFVVAVNALFYGIAWVRAQRSRRTARGGP